MTREDKQFSMLPRWGNNTYRFGFHYYKKLNLGDSNDFVDDVFECRGRGMCDAINMFVQHCLGQGYADFIVDTLVEE